mmetsp:Transcript_14840/g.20382  ORF Transcript_14840/g.20382 Transcript_14840/m.20382 type:complete len:84 (-) Transcript_14840:86-337(-)
MNEELIMLWRINELDPCQQMFESITNPSSEKVSNRLLTMNHSILGGWIYPLDLRSGSLGWYSFILLKASLDITSLIYFILLIQ